jgi:nicotinate-nucleotide pyrophosphorylase (carboxylating)
MHLCGVATLTNRFVAQAKKTKILSTRKTTPGLRALELMAVQAGGGHVHRRSLSDGILIKDNHLMEMLPFDAIMKARMAASPLHRVEIEVRNEKELLQALEAKPDIIMLDNFDIESARKAISIVDKRCLIEISGGISLENVGAYAALGADYISVGRITHSAPACNLGLDLCEKD